MRSRAALVFVVALFLGAGLAVPQWLSAPPKVKEAPVTARLPTSTGDPTDRPTTGGLERQSAIAPPSLAKPGADAGDMAPVCRINPTTTVFRSRSKLPLKTPLRLLPIMRGSWIQDRLNRRRCRARDCRPKGKRPRRSLIWTPVPVHTWTDRRGKSPRRLRPIASKARLQRLSSKRLSPRPQAQCSQPPESRPG